MEHYNTKLAAAKNIEVIHINLDSDEASMEKYATEFNFSFPIVSEAKADKMDILKGIAPTGVPGYKLVDSTGKVVAEGEEAKSKADEIAEGKTIGG